MFSIMLAGIKNKFMPFVTLTNLLFIILIGLIIVLVIPNINQIKEKLGFETRTSLKVKLNQEISNTNAVLSNNKELNQTIDILGRTNEVISDLAIRKDIETNKVTKKVSNIISKKKKAIDEKTKFEKDQLNSESIAEENIIVDTEQDIRRDIRTSTIQIDSIWEAYCEFNDDDTCKAKGEINA